MSHVRRKPYSQQKTTVTKRLKKRKTIGTIVIAVLFISIIISIVFIALSVP